MFESLGQNHPFHHANKRTAFTALVIFFKLNGLRFEMDTKKAEDFTVDMVILKLGRKELADIIEDHCVTIRT